ncbi:hypothetical protein [Nonomuraea turkmeniaca]|uniref:hypothetical protein n=1 Tax=Nonomuraea turkmeniaca TaxID=103838 RepID=UPI0014771B85|nr:hypothetical protein [Nonomuraea turkmeniaca]
MRHRSGTVFIVIAAALTVIGTMIHVFPPHQTVLTVFLGLAGTLFYVTAIARISGWTRQLRRVAPSVMIALAAAMWGALMGVAPVAGGTVALAVLGERQTCTVTEVDTETTRARGGRMRTTYVHTVHCPDARVHEIRSREDDRHEQGSPAEVTADPKGLMTAKFVAGAYQWTGVGVFAVLVLCVSALPFFARLVAPSPPPPSAPGGFPPPPAPWAAQPRRH